MFSQAVASNLWQQKLYILLQIKKNVSFFIRNIVPWSDFADFSLVILSLLKRLRIQLIKKSSFLEPVDNLAKELQYLNDAAKLYCSIVSTAYFPKKNKAVIQLVYFIVSIRVGRFSIFKLNLLGVVRLC